MNTRQPFCKRPQRRRPGRGLSAASAVYSFYLLLVIVCSAAFATDSHAEQTTRIRVLSYNIHHALGNDGKIDLKRIAKVITEADADIVALQEVDRTVTRSGSVDQAAQLARLTEMKFAFGANIPLQGGHYGNAVLSKLPVIRSTNHLLPRLDNGEQRGVIEVELQIGSTKETLTLFATHLDHRSADAERRQSAELINRLSQKLGNRPALLAGDLNDVATSETLQQFKTVWAATNNETLATIPAGNPRRQIDFILLRPVERWRVVETKTIAEPIASDHLPIITELELMTASKVKP